MSYITLEDNSATIELIAFQRALDEGGIYVHDNEIIIVTGRISARDENEPQIMVDTIRPISTIGELPVIEKNVPATSPAAATAQSVKKLWIKLPKEADVIRRNRQSYNLLCRRKQAHRHTDQNKSRTPFKTQRLPR